MQDALPSLASRYDAITQQRAEVHARIAALTGRSATCYDPDPCRAAIDDALMDSVNHDAALSRQQADLMVTAQARASKNWTEADQP